MSSVPECLADQYFAENLVGEGTYGCVYKAWDALKSDYVALKKLRVERSTEGISSTTLREISLLKELSHPNIVQIIDIICVPKKIFIVFEFLDIDLKVFMDCTIGPISRKLIKSYLHQMLQAIDYCHSRGVVHRDLKPQNLLVNSKGYIKLADFGLARAFSVPMKNLTTEVVTLWYKPPEILLGIKLYTMAVDIWSIGCILGEMFQKKPLFEGDSEIDQLFKIFQALGTPNDQVWPNVTSLPGFKPVFPDWSRRTFTEIIPAIDVQAVPVMEKLLEYNPENRMSAEDVLSSSYFDDAERMPVPDFDLIVKRRSRILKRRYKKAKSPDTSAPSD